MTALRRSELYNYGENIVLSCTLDGVDLFSSHDVDSDSPDILKICRSVAFHGEKLVSLSFPYTNEYLTTDSDWEGLFSSPTMFFPSYEGCIVRVFYENEKWWYITNHKLDAFNSRWGSSLSFGEMLLTNISKEELELSLNKSFHYMFLVRFNSDNEMTCRAPDDHEQAVFHVGTYTIKDNVPIFSLEEKCAIPHPPILTFDSPDSLRSYTENIHYSSAQGLVCITLDESGIPIITKIYSTTYARLNKIRGSATDVRLRYLELISSPKEQKEFYTYWSDHQPTFNQIEQTLSSTALYIYESYVTRFIKKQQIVIPPQEFSVMKKCHDWHISNRQLNRISYDVVLKTLLSSPSHTLLQIISFSKETRMMKESPLERKNVVVSTDVETAPSETTETI